MKPKEFRLSGKQVAQLERIAAANRRPAADLISLAVDALIAEAARHDGWLPLPSEVAPSLKNRCAH